MNKRRLILAVLLAIALLLPATPAGTEAVEAVEAVGGSVEAEPREAALELSENGAGEPEARVYELVLDPADRNATFEMNIGDILRIRVSDAQVTAWRSSRKDRVTLGDIAVDELGQYVDVRADAAAKRVKLTATLTGNKKKQTGVTLVINDPHVPSGIAFKEEMPAFLPVGATLDLNTMVVFMPDYTSSKLTWRASGSVKVTRDGLLTATRAGKAKITVKTENRLQKSVALQVMPNEVDKMSGAPSPADIEAVAGGWSLWPLSVKAKKNRLECQFYLLNGTGERVTQIENMTLTVAVGTKGNVVARYSNVGGRAFKSIVRKGKWKVVKLSLPIVDMTGVYLPDHAAKGTLFFGINQDEAVLKSKKASYPFIPTRFPLTDRVRSLALSQSEAALNIGEALILTAEVQPAYADDPTVTWTSSSPEVASVENGVVTALAAGTATITASAADGGGATASCAVTVLGGAPVIVPVTGIVLSRTSADMAVNETLTLTATVAPEDATNKAVNWTSDNADVATVENGLVTALAAGTATITASAADGSGVSAACAVNVQFSPYNVLVIDGSAVVGYTGTGGALVIPEKNEAGNPITRIAATAFRGNAALTAITVPASVAEIEDYAFEGCSALERAVLPNSLTVIGEGLFRNCSRLVSVTSY